MATQYTIVRPKGGPNVEIEMHENSGETEANEFRTRATESNIAQQEVRH